MKAKQSPMDLWLDGLENGFTSSPERVAEHFKARALLEAAPELLSALEMCSALLDAAINLGNCAKFADATARPMGELIEHAHSARVAIAKAKGEASL